MLSFKLTEQGFEIVGLPVSKMVIAGVLASALACLLAGAIAYIPFAPDSSRVLASPEPIQTPFVTPTPTPAPTASPNAIPSSSFYGLVSPSPLVPSQVTEGNTPMPSSVTTDTSYPPPMPTPIVTTTPDSSPTPDASPSPVLAAITASNVSNDFVSVLLFGAAIAIAVIAVVVLFREKNLAKE